MEIDPNLYLSIDPGLTHCCAAYVSMHGELADVIWSQTQDLAPNPSSRCKPDAGRALQFVNDIRWFVPPRARVVVEYQPALRKGGLSMLRNNCWAEGFFMGAFPTAARVHPSCCKKYWKIASGEYRTNKALAVDKARSLVKRPETVTSDHIADCVLNAVYAHRKMKTQ